MSKINVNTLKQSYMYLHKAIRMIHPEFVREILKMGFNPNETDEHGHTAFHILFANFKLEL